MNITQTFYDNMANQYDKMFLDWQSTTREQAVILDRIFTEYGFDRTAQVLDCACGIGTQAIGLASLGYRITASDISDGELAEAKERAEKNAVQIHFEHADFCALSDTFSKQFDIVIAMDNALPHMLSGEALKKAVTSIAAQTKPGGIIVAASGITIVFWKENRLILRLTFIRRKKAREFLFRPGYGKKKTII